MILLSESYKTCTFFLLIFIIISCSDTEIDLSNNGAINILGSEPERSDCLENNTFNNAYFGDLHVHTSFSADGYGWGVRTTPEDAYRYAFGGKISLSPVEGTTDDGVRFARIDRPLDFAAVTDHAEMLSETRLCTTKNTHFYSSETCKTFRARLVGVELSLSSVYDIVTPFPSRSTKMCGDDGEICAQLDRGVYGEIIQAATKWNDNSESCERTTFIGYEYSNNRLGSNMHRNVIFKNNTVPPNPISYYEAPRAWVLWDYLNKDCLQSGTECDVLAIPHNSNISNGRLFGIDYPGADSIQEQKSRASLRIMVEPIVEIMQHKGDSECRNGFADVLGAEDELCNFEKFVDLSDQIQTGKVETDNCTYGSLADVTPHLGPDCLSRLNFVRNALTEGLKEEKRIGVNPYKFGITASTDTHNGLAGGVDEKTWPGHLGRADDTVEKRTSRIGAFGNSASNPGGLIGVWAPENSRDALFEAMKKKEVFGTSGPRIQPRFFGGWKFEPSICQSSSLVEKAYQQGVAMGGDLLVKTTEAPVFVALALADIGAKNSVGTPLQRLQIIKGWVGDDGISHQKVFDVAGDANNGASVDLDSCVQNGEGFTQLCSVWQDPEFNADKRAVYYMRAIENPSCRFSAWQCSEQSQSERPPTCSHPEVRRAIQERAWSSPIWYTPG